MIVTHSTLLDLKQKFEAASPSALGAKIGVHYNTIRNWRNGAVIPSVVDAVKLAKALEVPVELIAAYVVWVRQGGVLVQRMRTKDGSRVKDGKEKE